MGLPFRQAAKIGAYVVKKQLSGKKYPLVLMLEPLFRCNLACAGCGKIDYPDEILNQRLSYEQCMAAIDDCGAPAVSIAGGEPLLGGQRVDLVAGRGGDLDGGDGHASSIPGVYRWEKGRYSVMASRTSATPSPGTDPVITSA